MIWQITEDIQDNRSLLKAINDVVHKTPGKQKSVPIAKR